MTDLYKKFSEAAKTVSSGKNPMWESVKQAYVGHLSDITADSLPEEIQIFFDSVRLRVISAEPLGIINNNDASFIANDIMYIADVLRSHRRTKP